MYMNPNILDEGNQLEVIEDNEDIMKRKIRCNNCGNIVEFGTTRMCSGFVGCDSDIKVNGQIVPCYFGDLMPRVMRYKRNQSPEYRNGKVYRYRDCAEGGLDAGTTD